MLGHPLLVACIEKVGSLGRRNLQHAVLMAGVMNFAGNVPVVVTPLAGAPAPEGGHEVPQIPLPHFNVPPHILVLICFAASSTFAFNISVPTPRNSLMKDPSAKYVIL